MDGRVRGGRARYADRWVRIVPATLCMCFAHEVRRGRLFAKGGGWLLVVGGARARRSSMGRE